MKKFKIAISLIFILFLVFSCGPKRREKGGITDTPEMHYNEGMKFINTQQYTKAYNEFKLATTLDPDYAPAYEGMAYAYLGEGKLESAERAAKTSISKGDDYWKGYNALGKVYLAMNENKDALKRFEKAFKINENSIVAARNAGYALFKMGEYQEARQWYNIAFEIKANDKVTMDYLDELNEMQKAQAGMGKIAKKISSHNKVTRADIAALFVDELNLGKHFKEEKKHGFVGYGEKKKTIEDSNIPDVPQDHWAYSFINKIVKYGIMDLANDGNFHPNKEITKANYAVFISRILIKFKDNEKLATKYIGSPSPYKDVPNSHYAFNGIMICVNKGILTPEISGIFGLNDDVPGRNAVMAIKKLKLLLEK